MEPGRSVLDTVQSAIAHADFVCVVFPKGLHTTSVAFEMGLAVGNSRPVLAFVEPGADAPSLMGSVTVARTGFDDAEAINFYLDAFLEHGGSKRLRGRSRPSSLPAAADTSWVLETINSIATSDPQMRGSEFEALVADLFQQAGYVVSPRAPEAGDRGVDMAVWIDETDSSLGNPVLVQVKVGRLSDRQLQFAEHELRQFIAKTPVQAGILIYWDRGGKDLSRPSADWPLVIRFSVFELADLVGSGEFVRELRARRNRAVHGPR